MMKLDCQPTPTKSTFQELPQLATVSELIDQLPAMVKLSEEELDAIAAGTGGNGTNEALTSNHNETMVDGEELPQLASHRSSSGNG